MTEFEPRPPTSIAAVAASTAAQQGAVLTSGYHPPRRDLGSRPVNVTCPYCTRTGKTRTNYNCGDVSKERMHICSHIHMICNCLYFLFFTPLSYTCLIMMYMFSSLTFTQCTLISVIILLLFCLPFFWIPFICPSCQDVEHHCSNCGRLVGKSRAECCA